MPIFEFECVNGHRVEIIDIRREYVDAASVPCRECSEPAGRVVSRTNWQYGEGPKESHISKAIKRVKAAERAGKA